MFPGLIEQPVSSWLNSESCLEAKVFRFGSSWIWFSEHEATFVGHVSKNWRSQTLGNTEEHRRNASLQHGENKRNNVGHGFAWTAFRMSAMEGGVVAGPAEFICADALSLGAAGSMQ
jgi:hypothetical protein